MLTAVVYSGGSAACLRCCPIGDSGVFSVGILFVVKRRWSCPRASLEADGLWAPIPRMGPAREANEGVSSRGDLSAPRSPMPVEKAILLEIHCSARRQPLFFCSQPRLEGGEGAAVRGRAMRRKGGSSDLGTRPI